MIVAFDVNSLRGIKTGVGIYSYNLIRALRDLCANDTFKYYSCSILKGGLKNPVDIPADSLNFIYSMRISQKLLFNLWKYLKFPKIELLIGRVDIVHGLFHLVPITRKAKKVVTIYDLTFITHPEAHSLSNIKVLWRLTEYSIEKSDAILTISENTKKDILSIFGVDESKVTVAFPGVNHQIFKPMSNTEQIDSVKKKFSISKKYIFYLGTIEPRKNVDVLLKSFLIIKEKTKSKYQLVLSGKIGWKVDILMKEIYAHGGNNDVIYAGRTTREEAVALYNGAEVFVYPSQYEGFGIPLVEAMACGCPVITSNVSSMPEVVENAGLLVEPGDIESLATAMLEVLENDTLREKMRNLSIKRSQKFSWIRTAEIVKGLYDEVLQQ